MPSGLDWRALADGVVGSMFRLPGRPVGAALAAMKRITPRHPHRGQARSHNIRQHIGSRGRHRRSGAVLAHGRQVAPRVIEIRALLWLQDGSPNLLGVAFRSEMGEVISALISA